MERDVENENHVLASEVISSLAEYPAQMHIYNSACTCHYDDGFLVIKCLSPRKDIWTEGAQPTSRNMAPPDVG